MRWWTSDLHLGHANIIRYCHRPFPDVEAMDGGLIERWNRTVGEHDEVWILGDFALSDLAGRLPLVKVLQGRKVLVPGNHDLCWTGRTKDVAHWTEEYLEAGFDAIVDGPTEATVGSRTVVVDHFPYHGDSKEGPERFADRRPIDRGQWILHGHVHDRWRQAGRQINVGVDAWGGYPINDGDLEALMAAGPQDLPPLPW